MCSKTKLILSLLLVSFLILSNETVGLAKCKTMYTKKSYVITNENGNKCVIPQYHKIRVKLKAHKPEQNSDVIDFNVVNKNPLTEFNDVLFPLLIVPESVDATDWKIPNKTKIVYDGFKGKIKTSKLRIKKPKYDKKQLPYNMFKSYMSYRAISSTGSPQYRLQCRAYTDYKTGVRMVDGRYCIAVGPKVATKIGTKLELIYKGGKKVPAIVADQKAGTIDGYRHPDGSAVEFVVDNSALPRCARLMGDMSALKKFSGRITKIKVFKK